jgi:sugar phosphate isomerase/epimerase
VTLDHSHFTCQGLSADSVKPLVQYSSHLHARGAALGEMQTSFSRNTTDFDLVMQHLKEMNYTGRLCFEYCWIEWEQCNRTDNVAETLLLRKYLMDRA